jgi:hypothetical protein
MAPIRKPLPPTSVSTVVASKDLDWISHRDSLIILLNCMALEPKKSTAFFYEGDERDYVGPVPIKTEKKVIKIVEDEWEDV